MIHVLTKMAWKKLITRNTSVNLFLKPDQQFLRRGYLSHIAKISPSYRLYYLHTSMDLRNNLKKVAYFWEVILKLDWQFWSFSFRLPWHQVYYWNTYFMKCERQPKEKHHCKVWMVWLRSFRGELKKVVDEGKDRQYLSQ